MAADLFDSWFRIADKDRDGVISGAEAVEFFQRSNLSQETLFQVWKLVAGDKPALTKPQFYTTLRLISLAQRSKGTLPQREARLLLTGMGPAVPPPSMAGLQSGRAPVPAQADPFAASAGPVDRSAFPPMQQADVQRYQEIFDRMDPERRGIVQGGDCFGAFMQWGLPRGTLKDIWALVAGDQGHLTQQQFVTCLYLMDLAKKGAAPPARLPPGPFPPIATSLSRQVSTASSRASGDAGTPKGFSIEAMQQSQYDVFSNTLPAPGLPPKAGFVAPKAQPLEPQTPTPSEEVLASVGPLERQRLQNDAKLAQEAERKLHETRAAAAAARAKEEHYRSALQALTLFKSRTQAALLQAQERCDSASAEADAMESQYELAWAQAEASHSKGTALLDALTRAKGRKAEMGVKLGELRKDIEALGSISEEQVAAEEAAVSVLLEEVAAAEAKKAQMEARGSALRQERDTVSQRLAELQQTLDRGMKEVDATQAELGQLADKLKAGDDAAAVTLQGMLRKSAALYRDLLRHATDNGVPVPEEAALELSVNGQAHPEAEEGKEEAGRRPQHWLELAMARAADWEDFEDAGFTLVPSLAEEDRYVAPPVPKPQAPKEPPPSEPPSAASASTATAAADFEFPAFSTGGEVTSKRSASAAFEGQGATANANKAAAVDSDDWAAF